VTVAELPEQIRRRVVVDEGGCWRYGGSKGRGGYAHIWWKGRHVYAHRVSFEHLVGPIPNGHELDHVRARGCRHRDCINPAHLEPVTRKVNCLRSESVPARNARKKECVRGHELAPPNLYARPNGQARRECRACWAVRRAEETPERRASRLSGMREYGARVRGNGSPQ
jgi:hypothetical protein